MGLTAALGRLDAAASANIPLAAAVVVEAYNAAD